MFETWLVCMALVLLAAIVFVVVRSARLNFGTRRQMVRQVARRVRS